MSTVSAKRNGAVSSDNINFFVIQLALNTFI